MYKILKDIGMYIQSPPLFISLVLGALLGIGIFNLVVNPLHNMVKYHFIRKFGDESAFLEELVSKKPRDNVHIVGLLSSVFLNVGFASPTLFDNTNFRRPKLHTFFVSISGVLTYFAVFLVTYIIFAVPRVINLFSISSVKFESLDVGFFGCVYYVLFSAVYYLAITCLYSAIFNLLPVYPLDMGDTLYMYAPLNWQDALRNNELFISLGLFVLNFMVLGSPRGLIYIVSVPIRNTILEIVAWMFGVPLVQT